MEMHLSRTVALLLILQTHLEALHVLLLGQLEMLQDETAHILQYSILSVLCFFYQYLVLYFVIELVTPLIY